MQIIQVLDSCSNKAGQQGGVELQMLLAPNCGKSMRFAATEQVEQRVSRVRGGRIVKECQRLCFVYLSHLVKCKAKPIEVPASEVFPHAQAACKMFPEDVPMPLGDFAVMYMHACMHACMCVCMYVM